MLLMRYINAHTSWVLANSVIERRECTCVGGAHLVAQTRCRSLRLAKLSVRQQRCTAVGSIVVSGTDKNVALINLHRHGADRRSPAPGPFADRANRMRWAVVRLRLQQPTSGIATSPDADHRVKSKRWVVPAGWAHFGNIGRWRSIKCKMQNVRRGQAAARLGCSVACTNPAQSLPDLPSVAEAFLLG